MNRQTFMRELSALLSDIPELDREDAIAYYNDYFDEAGKENEQLVIRELGSPQKVADTIREGLLSSEHGYREYTEHAYAGEKSADEWKAPMTVRDIKSKHENFTKEEQKTENKTEQAKVLVSKFEKKLPWFVIVLLAIFVAPMLIGVLAGLFGGLLGLAGGLLGVTIGIAGGGFGVFFGGVVCFMVGFIRLFANSMEGLTSMGVGSFLIAIGILLVILFVWLVAKWIPALVKGFMGGCRYVYQHICGWIRMNR